MNPKTGEIKAAQTIPGGHLKIAKVGDTIEATHDRRLPGGPTRKVSFQWKVVQVIEGTPGRIVLEAVPDTMKPIKGG